MGEHWGSTADTAPIRDVIPAPPEQRWRRREGRRRRRRCRPRSAFTASVRTRTRWRITPCAMALAELFPQRLALGLELRGKVAEFTRARLRALRAARPGHFGNVACVRGNAMKHLPHFFHRAQLSKLFFLFPDPHFKRTKHKWRIISPAMLAEYGYVLRPGGLVYTVTDVPELHQWMLQHFGEHPLFEPLTPAQLAADPLVPLLPAVTEEGQRAQRAGRPPRTAVFRRRPDPGALRGRGGGPRQPRGPSRVFNKAAKCPQASSFHAPKIHPGVCGVTPSHGGC
ncbi:tRNA (guanine-N(7)-)-methyltransferase [Myiozetetes cayanensis]|uniref:tRNA (guanine-N(7)-)-methyltransferase n=1 Tax=Myiozetetes cayanensis TaxID=478635 RepID=UPI00215FBA5D|nr:tRNA (guanine-N(7)-)-methyltransferase [Myiozetetes cayanensis]